MLVCIFLLTAVSASLMKLALAQSRQTRMQHRHLQAEWLAQAGLDRAAARLAGNASYTGETWNIPAEQLGEAGEVRIMIDQPGEADEPRRVRVVAVYPVNVDLRAQVSRERIVTSAPVATTEAQP
ncbi:MAG: hypothetical protein R3B90_04210 [Planctomycetaceae bacterium]